MSGEQKSVLLLPSACCIQGPAFLSPLGGEADVTFEAGALAELNWAASVLKSQTLSHVLDLLVRPRTICARFTCEYD